MVRWKIDKNVARVKKMIGPMNDAKKENRDRTRHARISVARYSRSSGIVNDFSNNSATTCQKAKSINHDAKLSRVKQIMIIDRRASK